jgi:asparagine synthase (glutamine-hydrolysing)
MCGIAGEFITQSDGVIDLESIVPMLKVLAHRGPDDWGYYTDHREKAMLLHSRLSIVDLKHGQQPLSNEDGTVWVSVNGEIYGYRQMTRDLEARGHSFRTNSDTEVIVHLYEEYGEAFVEKLRGEFAIALYDEKKSALYLVRDRFGIKPLFYSIERGSLIFASEMKSIFRHSKTRREFDESILFSMLCTSMPPAATLFKNVKQVEPGCFLKATATGDIRQVKYWDLPLLQRDDEDDASETRKEESVVEEFRHLLEESVRLRLHGDVEVGAYLSGGIDSCSVVRLMSLLSDKPLKAFTVGFENRNYDETEQAKMVAEQSGLEHHLIRLGAGDLASHFVESLWHSEIPVFNSHGAAKFLLSAEAGRHVKVVLTGEGADEVLMGYNHFRHQTLLEDVRLHPQSREARRRLNKFLTSERTSTDLVRSKNYQDYERVTSLFGSYPYTILRALDYPRKLKPFFSNSFKERFAAVDHIAELAQHFNSSMLRGLPPVVATQYFFFKTDLANYILNYLGDREEMAHSIEGRVPFLDHKLVEFVCRVPLHLKLKESCNKFLLREAVSDVLPEAVTKRRKKIFLAPSRETLGLQKSNSLFEDYFAPEFVNRVGVFDPKMLSLARQTSRFLPESTRSGWLSGGLLTAALSLHIIYDLFCKNFEASVARFNHSTLDYKLENKSSARSPVIS